MRYIFTVLFAIAIISKALPQDTDDIHFNDEPEFPDTITSVARPVSGYRVLLKYLESQIAENDTLGKKFRIDLYNVRFRVDAKGCVDSAVVAIRHSAGPIHYQIAKEVLRTEWIPAKDHGRPVASKIELFGSIYINKRVLKKYRR